MNIVRKIAVASTVAASTVVLAGTTVLAVSVTSSVGVDSIDDSEDFVAHALGTPEFAEICLMAPSTVDDLYLSPAFAIDKYHLAADMYVAWMIEVAEEALGYNLTESAEAEFADALFSCVDYGFAV